MKRTNDNYTLKEMKKKSKYYYRQKHLIQRNDSPPPETSVTKKDVIVENKKEIDRITASYRDSRLTEAAAAPTWLQGTHWRHLMLPICLLSGHVSSSCFPNLSLL